MKIQTLPFVGNPERATKLMDELRPMIDACYAAQERGSSEHELPSQALAIFWWQELVDFVELLDDDNNRVGLIMCNLYRSEATQKRYAAMVVAYIAPEHRGRGYFKQMLSYLKVVYQAKNVSRIDVNVPLGIDFCMGQPVQTVYRTEL